MKYTIEEIKEILKLHKMWIDGEEGGVRAYLSYADLRGVDLSDADLSDADLSDADLSDADLSDADLSYANLRSADLRGVDLSDADLSYANLRSVDLSDADLSYANLRSANLRSADLSYANLSDVKYNCNTSFFALSCPEEGSFIGYKKASLENGMSVIVKIMVMEDSKRSSATTRKCRCSKAKILSITSIDGEENFDEAISNYDCNFVYKVGEIVEVEDFDEDRWNECSTGIHFFITREEAVNY